MKNEVKMKDERKRDIYCWIVSASMLIYGYSLVMSAAINNQQLKQYYQVQFNISLMISLYNGFLAIGGMLSSYLIQYFVKITTKRKSFFISIFTIIVSSAASAIPNIGTLYISRFFLGLGCGFSMMVGGMYIKQTYSQAKRRPLGGVYSLSKLIGSELCLFFSAFLIKYQIINMNLFINLGVGILALLQLVLIKFILPQIALQMLMKQKIQQLQVVLSLLYNQDDIPIRRRELQKISSELSIQLDLSNQNTRNGIISAIHCGFLRQFCGVPYFILYSSQMMQMMHSPYANISNLVAASWRMVAGIIGIWIICLINRRKLIVFTTIFGCIFSFIVAIFNGIQQSNLTIVSMILFILPTASCLQIITWYYPFECTRPLYGRFAAFFSWLGMGCLIIIPPYISAAMPNNESYPTFLFFGVYLSFSIYINYEYLVDVDQPKRHHPNSFISRIASSSQLQQRRQI